MQIIKTIAIRPEIGCIIFIAERQSHPRLPGTGAWIERTGSEGTRPALLPAGPVPERWNVKSVFIETPDGPAINWTSLLAILLFFHGHEYQSTIFIQSDSHRGILITASLR